MGDGSADPKSNSPTSRKSCVAGLSPSPPKGGAASPNKMTTSGHVADSWGLTGGKDDGCTAMCSATNANFGIVVYKRPDKSLAGLKGKKVARTGCWLPEKERTVMVTLFACAVLLFAGCAAQFQRAMSDHHGNATGSIVTVHAANSDQHPVLLATSSQVEHIDGQRLIEKQQAQVVKQAKKADIVAIPNKNADIIELRDEQEEEEPEPDTPKRAASDSSTQMIEMQQQSRRHSANATAAAATSRRGGSRRRVSAAKSSGEQLTLSSQDSVSTSTQNSEEEAEDDTN